MTEEGKVAKRGLGGGGVRREREEGRGGRGARDVCRKQGNRGSGREGFYVSEGKHDPAVRPGCWGYI